MAELRYKFMIRPVSGFHIPADVTISYDTKRDEPDTMHGSVIISRELTDAEMFHFDIYPVGYTAKDIKAVEVRR